MDEVLLSKREGETLLLLARGLQTKFIARELGCSTRTAMAHAASLSEKLANGTSRAGIIGEAFRQGYLVLDDEKNIILNPLKWHDGNRIYKHTKKMEVLVGEQQLPRTMPVPIFDIGEWDCDVCGHNETTDQYAGLYLEWGFCPNCKRPLTSAVKVVMK